MQNQMKEAKLPFIFFNLALVLCGVVFIVLGSTLMGLYMAFVELIQSQAVAPAAMVIFLGLLIFAISGVGFYGVRQDDKTLLKAFAGVLLFVITVQIGAGLLAMSEANEIPKLAKRYKEEMLGGLQEVNINEEHRHQWDVVQTGFKCCGVNGPEDWMNMGNIAPPRSCYDVYNSLYKSGCWDIASMSTTEFSSALGITCLCLIIIDGFALAFALLVVY